jgi:hypothetical protein
MCLRVCLGTRLEIDTGGHVFISKLMEQCELTSVYHMNNFIKTTVKTFQDVHLKVNMCLWVDSQVTVTEQTIDSYLLLLKEYQPSPGLLGCDVV